MNETTTEHAPDGTEVRLKRTMPGTFEGQWATVRHRHPVSGKSSLPRLAWLECEVIWSHGTAEGFWAARAEYDIPPTEQNDESGWEQEARLAIRAEQQDPQA